jgi:hydroxybutyrate-dimer hydrolase
LFSDKFIPLHHYLREGLGLMFDHLKNGTPLPPSQVVRTRPRGIDPRATPPYTLADVPPLEVSVHLPAVTLAPNAGDLIRFVDNLLLIPD